MTERGKNGTIEPGRFVPAFLNLQNFKIVNAHNARTIVFYFCIFEVPENFQNLKKFRHISAGKPAEEKTGMTLKHKKIFLAGYNCPANMDKINHSSHLSQFPKFNKNRKEECANSIIPKSKMKKKSRKRTAKNYRIRYKQDTKNYKKPLIQRTSQKEQYKDNLTGRKYKKIKKSLKTFVFKDFSFFAKPIEKKKPI